MKKLAKYLDLFLKVGFWVLIILSPLMIITMVGVGTLMNNPAIPDTLKLETNFVYHGLSFVMKSNLDNYNYMSWLSVIELLIGNSVLLYNIVQIRGILAGVLEDNPFSKQIIKCVKKLAYGIIIGSLIFSTTQAIINYLSLNHLNILESLYHAGIEVNYTFNIFENSLIVEGLLVLLLAHVFQYGLQLQEEYDATL